MAAEKKFVKKEFYFYNEAGQCLNLYINMAGCCPILCIDKAIAV